MTRSPISAARALLVSYLAPLEDLTPPVRVIPYARQVSPPDRPTVLVRFDGVAPATGAGARRVRTYRFALLCVPGKVRAEAAEDEADALLEDVLAVLDDSPQVSWSTADRGLYEDTEIPSHEVTITLPLKIGA